MRRTTLYVGEGTTTKRYDTGHQVPGQAVYHSVYLSSKPTGELEAMVSQVQLDDAAQTSAAAPSQTTRYSLLDDLLNVKAMKAKKKKIVLTVSLLRQSEGNDSSLSYSMHAFNCTQSRTLKTVLIKSL